MNPLREERPITLASLIQTFALDTAITAITGAGGKTSALFRLGRAMGAPTFLANSAHLSLEQVGLADHSYFIPNRERLPGFEGGIAPGTSLFHGAEIPGQKRVAGLDEQTLQGLRELAGYHAVPLLIEADGARGRPLKAPAAHEPPVPSFVQTVLVCAGLSGLGLPLDEKGVFRAELFGMLSGLSAGQAVTVEALARVLGSAQGGLKNIPAGARRLALINQADSSELQAQAARLAELLQDSFNGVICASLRGPLPEPAPEIHAVYRPTAGIVLAAGGSSRLGRPKQLLQWQGEPLVRRAARTALEGGLSPVVVVVGAEAARVSAALEGLDVTVVCCAAWASGQSASLRSGLEEAQRLRSDLGGVMFLLCDQPFVGADLVRAVRELHSRTLAPAAAPRAEGRRGNPVLFDRRLFPALERLEGDAGGRQVLTGLDLALLDWPDGRIHADIDTSGDYERLSSAGG